MQLSLVKTLALGAILIATAPLCSYAADEGAGHKRGHHGEQLQATLDKLSLTDDQKAKIKVVTDKLKADNEAYMKEHGADLKAAREAGDKEKMKTLMGPMMEKRKASMDEIKAVLTDEQKTKLAELMPAHGAHHPKKDK